MGWTWGLELRQLELPVDLIWVVLGGPNSKYNATAQTILPNIIKHNKILWSPISNFLHNKYFGIFDSSFQHWNRGKDKNPLFYLKIQ